jgi:hypothetical protein
LVWRRVQIGLVLLIVAVVPPLYGFQAVLGANAATMLLFGIMVAVINTVTADLRLAFAASAVYLLLIPVSIVVGSDPLAGASLMAVICLGVGMSSRWLRFGGFFAIPLGTAFVMTLPPSLTTTMHGDPAKTRHLLAILGATAIASVWSAFGTRFVIGSMNVPLSVKNDRADALLYTVMMTVLVSLSTWWVLGHGINNHGVWLILTLLIVLQVGRGKTKHKIVHRIGGTVAGTFVAAAIVGLGEPAWFVAVMFFLMLLGLLAFVGQEPYAVYTFFLTNVVLLSLGRTDGVATSFDRLAYTLLGVGLAVCALGIEALVHPEKAAPTGAPVPPAA